MPFHSRRNCQPVFIPTCEPVSQGVPLSANPSYSSLSVPCAPIYSSTTPVARPVEADPVKRALGEKSYADVIPEIRDRLRSSLWATDADKAEIKFVERALKPGDKPGFSKEVTFDAKPSAVTPHFETVRFGQDHYGQFYRAEWKYQTGATNLLKIYGGDWEVKLERSADGHHYSVKLPEDFVGAVKITINGKSHIVYSHAASESAAGASPAKEPPKSGTRGLNLPETKADSEVESERQKLAAERAELAKQKKELLAAQEKLKQDQQREAELQKQREQALEKQRQELAKWKAELDGTARALNEQREAAKRERGELDATKRKLDEGRADLTRREGELTGERNKLTALKATLDARGGELKAEAERLAGVKASLDGTEEKLKAQAGALKQQQLSLQELKDGLDVQKKKQDDRETALGKKGAELDGREKELGARERKLKEDEAGLAALDKKLKDDKQLDGDARKKLEAEQKELAERLKNERDQFEKDRKALTGLQDDLKRQREELTAARAGLAGVRAELEKRGAALDRRDSDLKTEAARLDDLRKQLEAREKALKAEADLKRDRSVSPLPPAPPLDQPKLKWEAAASTAGSERRPLGSPELKLPSWVERAAALGFEREALEQAWGRMSGSYESYLAAGDYKQSERIRDEAGKLTGEKRKQFDAARESHEIHIENAYRPLIDAHNNVRIAVVELAALQADYKGEVPPAKKVREVLEKIVAASDAVDVALFGTDATDVGKEYNAGVTAKAAKLRIDIGILEKLPKRDKAEESRLGFLRDRLVRMEEAERFLLELKPEVDRMARGIRIPKSEKLPAGGINESFDPMKIDLFGASTPAPASLGTQLSSIKAPIAKLMDGEASEANYGPIKAIASAKPTEATAVTKQLGNSATLELWGNNLEAALKHVQSDAYRARLESRNRDAHWNKAAGILAAAEPLPQRKEKLAEFVGATLGRKLSTEERSALDKGCDAFEAAPAAGDRTSALLGILRPVMVAEQERAKADQVKAAEAIQGALDSVKSGKALLAVADLSQKTERAFLDFVRKVPEFGDEVTFAEAYRDEAKMKITVEEALKAHGLAKEAVNAEVAALLVVTGGKAGTTSVHRRIEILQQRNKNLQRWLDRRNGKFIPADE